MTPWCQAAPAPSTAGDPPGAAAGLSRTGPRSTHPRPLRDTGFAPASTHTTHSAAASPGAPHAPRLAAWQGSSWALPPHRSSGPRLCVCCVGGGVGLAPENLHPVEASGRQGPPGRRRVSGEALITQAARGVSQGPGHQGRAERPDRVTGVWASPPGAQARTAGDAGSERLRWESVTPQGWLPGPAGSVRPGARVPPEPRKPGPGRSG